MGHVTVKLNETCMLHFTNNLNSAKDAPNFRIFMGLFGGFNTRNMKLKNVIKYFAAL